MSRTLHAGIALAGAALLAIAPAPAVSQEFPSRPVRMIVTTPAGSGVDILARAVAQGLSESYPQQVVVENRPGAGGLIGAQAIANAQPDGYMIGIASTAHIVSPMLQVKPAYRPIEDFAPVAQLTSLANVLLASAPTKAASVAELLALVRSQPGKVNYASLGTGTAAHIAVEIFNRAGALNAVHVPFKALSDLHTSILSGEVQYVNFFLGPAMPLIRSGKVNVLAVTSPSRLQALPNVPTLAELGMPTGATEFSVGVLGPAALPGAVVQKLHADIVAVLRRPQTRERFAEQGGVPTVDTTPERYGAQLRAEQETYRKLVADLGLKPQ